MQHQFTYEGTLADSQKVEWAIEDVIGNGKDLDFSRPFLPETLARAEKVTCLSSDERLLLNQIRGHEYLFVFGLVEEFILPFVVDHARPQLHGDGYRVRALLQFAAEEAKHIQLFKRFRAEFLRGFGTPCRVIGPADAVAAAVLDHSPLAVALAILHIEWMTQSHYLESVRGSVEADPQFRSLLRHHWMDEAQHAKLDTLTVEALAADCTAEEIAKAVDEYAAIVGILDGGLMQQVEFDLECLEASIERMLSEEERAEVRAVQQQAVRWTFLGSGMLHPKFQSTLGEICPDALPKIAEMAKRFS